MAAGINPIFPQTPRSIGVTFVAADALTLKPLLLAGANGALVDFLSISTDDTVANSMLLYLTIGGTDYRLGRVEIPASSGNISGTKAVNGLNIADLPWLSNIRDLAMSLGANVTLRASMVAAVTAAKTVWVTGGAGDY